MKHLTLLLLCGLFLVSCGDKEVPVITFISPAANSGIDAGATVGVQVEVTDNDELSRIIIGEGANALEPITTFNSPEKHTEAFNLIAPADAPSGTQLTITVNAIDASNNADSEDLVLVVN